MRLSRPLFDAVGFAPRSARSASLGVHKQTGEAAKMSLIRWQAPDDGAAIGALRAALRRRIKLASALVGCVLADLPTDLVNA